MADRILDPVIAMYDKKVMYIFEKYCIVGIVKRWEVNLAYVPERKKNSCVERITDECYFCKYDLLIIKSFI